MTDPIQRMPAVTPTWATDAGTTFEPILSERQAGFPVNSRPPARWQNDYQRKVFQIVDNAAAAMRKTWTHTLAVDPTVDFKALGWHKGYYYAVTESGNEKTYRSLDLRRWTKVATIIKNEDPTTIASDGTRLVFGRTGLGSNSHYSDDNGVTNAGALTGITSEPSIYYLPQAGLWVGYDVGAAQTIQSALGAAYVVTPSAVGAAIVGHFGAAENADGSILLVGGAGGIFSTNGGTTWAATTDGGSLLGYYYSEVRGNFVGWTAAGALHDMTGTAGTWDSVAFATIPNFAPEGMFDMHAGLYAFGESDTLSPAPASKGLVMSLDVGATWEGVHTFGDDMTFGPLHPVAPVIGERPGANGGFIGMIHKMEGIAPMFPGVDFAAALVP